MVPLRYKSIEVLLFVGAILSIALGFGYSPVANVVPEPGASSWVYSHYVAMTRVGESLEFPIAPPQIERLFEEELNAAPQLQKSCRPSLSGPKINCQIGSPFPRGSRLQHWKSYLLPSLLAAATLQHQDLIALNSLKEQGRDLPRAQLATIQILFRDLGIRFFSILFLIKVLAFVLVWQVIRSRQHRVVVGLSIITFSAIGVAVDAFAQRGQGLYQLDRLIAGSPLYSSDVSIVRAVMLAFVDVGKGILVPIMTSGPAGNTPRGVVVFVMFLMLVGVLFTQSPRVLLLAPLGLTTHFTTFCLLALFVAPQLVWVFRKSWKPASTQLLQIALLCIPILTLQLLVIDFASSQLGFWGVVGLVLSPVLISLAMLYSKNFEYGNAEKAIRPIQSLIWLLIYFSSYVALCIGWIASSYGNADSRGFWLDNFRREAVGRVAPLMWAMGIFYVLLKLVQVQSRTRGSQGSTAETSLRARHSWSIVGFTCAILFTILIELMNRNTFL